VRILNFENGNKHEERFSYHPNGQIKLKSNFINNIAHGERIRYNVNGNVETIFNFKDGNKLL